VLWDWLMSLLWLTSVPLGVSSLTRLLSYMLTPFATRLSLEFTMLMPLAPINAVPARLVAPVADVVTVELFAAMLPPEAGSLAPAVTLSIWLSRSGCLFWVVLDVLWP